MSDNRIKLRSTSREEAARRVWVARYLQRRLAMPKSLELMPERLVRLKHGWFQIRHVTVFTDGAVRPAQYGWAGIGFAICTHAGELIEAQGRESSATTRLGINETEIYAGVMGLMRAAELLGRMAVVIRTDSELFVRMASGNAQPRKENLQRAWRAFERERARHRWVHVMKISRADDRMRLPDRLSKEGAAVRKQRAEGRFAGVRWVKVVSGTTGSERARQRQRTANRPPRRLTL